MIYIIGCLLAGAMSFVWFLFTRENPKSKRRIPPGPYRFPILGSIPALALNGSNENESLWNLSKIYGPIMSLWLGSRLAIVVSSAKVAQEVLKDFDKSTASRPSLHTINLLTFESNDLVFAADGPVHKMLRKICVLNLLTKKRIHGFRKIRMDEQNNLCNHFRKELTNQNSQVNARAGLHTTSLNIIMRVCIGKRFEISTPSNPNPEGDHFFGLVKEGFDIAGSVNLGDYIPILRPFDLQGLTKRVKKSSAEMKLFLGKQLELHLGKKNFSPSDEADADFMDTLLSLPDEDKLTKEQIFGIVSDMLFAGSDTSATTIEWALIELIRHPEVMSKLKNELDAALGQPGKAPYDPDTFESTISDLPYLAAVVRETHRLHPVVPLLVPHETTEEFLLGGGKYMITPGTIIMINSWAISRDPSNWENSLEFRPERFLEADGNWNVFSDFRSIPFGYGRRSCPGYAMGQIVVAGTLARLVHEFDWSKGDSELTVEEKFHLSLSPAKELVARVLPRA